MAKFFCTDRRSTDKEANIMASNEAEALATAASVDSLKELTSERALNRRRFMAAVGLVGAAAGAALLSAPVAAAQQPVGNGYDPVDVLNLLLNLKYLQATFYSFITQGKDLPAASTVTTGTGAVYNQPAKLTITGTNAQQITDMLNEIYYDELEQLIALRSFLGVAAVNRATMNLLGTSAANAAFAAPPTTTTLTPSQAIGLARMLEDVTLQAFAGAAPYLSGTYLNLAAQAMAVDGFHSGAIRLFAIQTGAVYQGTEGTELLTSFQVGTNAGSAAVYALLGTVVPAVGAPLITPAVPTGAIITAVSLNANATPTGFTVKSSTVINNVSSITGLATGQPITGTNIPALTYIVSVGTAAPYSITLSQAATAASTSTATPTGYVTAGSNMITGVSSLAGIIVGQTITGTNVPAGATITAATGSTITISTPATKTNVVSLTGIVTTGSNVITGASSVTGVAVGQPITDASNLIPPGTTISSVVTAAPYSITLSAAATGSSTSAETFTTPPAVTLTAPTGEALVAGQSVLSLSEAALVTSSTSAYLASNDPYAFDVVPADIGPGVATTGPTLDPSSSPALYQGFFETAGSATSSGSAPAGFAFARNFSQVLSVLYGSSTVGTFEGGFFPVGAAGNITVV
jgi:hypothetical protein